MGFIRVEKKSKRTLRTLIENFTNNITVKSSLYQFLGHYQQKLKIYPTLIQFEKMLDELQSLSNGSGIVMNNIVQQSIRRGWLSFFACKDGKYSSFDNMSGQVKADNLDHTICDEEF